MSSIRAAGAIDRAECAHVARPPGASVTLPLLLLLAFQQASAAKTCTKEAIQGMAPSDAVIDTVASTADPVPHCLIDGHIITQNPGPNRVNFRLQLPDSGFNGRYYFIGMGGAAGFVPTNSQLPPGNPITAGFATAGTDTGHSGDTLDWSFTRTSPAKTVDHFHRAAHVTAVATQQITKRYYGVDKLYRYISGCSGGGRMGMVSSEQHPEDFDGHLIGAPGRSSATILMFMWAAKQMLREPGAWVSPTKLEMLETKVNAACDATDGATDGVVWWPDRCSYDPAQLQCKGKDQPDCLTQPEIKTVKAILAGPRSPKGQITGGMPITNIGSGWRTFVGAVPPPWSESTKPESLAKSSSGFVMGHVISKTHFGPDFDFVRDFDFNDQSDIDAWWAAVERIGFGGPHTADLRGIEKQGHKVLWWHGVSDAGPTWDTTLGYFADAQKILGNDAARLARTAQLYLIPGMLHCGGGTGPNDGPDRLLETLINWVEKGQTPGPVVVHRGQTPKPVFEPLPGTQTSGVRIPAAAGTDREFLLCPYPLRARFNGKAGGEMKAENWSCQRP
jgi:feruloyl esterase